MSLPHPEPISGASYSAVELMADDARLVMLDQRRLPGEEHYVELTSAADVARAITDMVVRGAPAIGIAAAYGMAAEAAHARADSHAAFDTRMRAAAQILSRSRPTAVNLAWAVSEIVRVLEATTEASPTDRAIKIAQRARAIHRQDVAACRAIGARGAAFLDDGATVLTHCNAGALATGGYGTALGVIRSAIALGKRISVLASETRPYLQGARLTAWELSRDGIEVEVITDGMVGHFFSRGVIDAVVVGADRIARSGDVANKIGTYGVACLARMHERPFFVAAPRSTLDPACADGGCIPIEERASDEVAVVAGVRMVPAGVRARHPAFDVTPAHLVSRLFTETGDVAGPDAEELMRAT